MKSKINLDIQARVPQVGTARCAVTVPRTSGTERTNPTRNTANHRSSTLAPSEGERAGVRGHSAKTHSIKFSTIPNSTLARASAYTLIELIVCLALMGVLIPVIVQGLRAATLAGEVSERKAIAARIAERVLNETIVNGQTLTATGGSEQDGPFQFRWTVKNEPWSTLGTLVVNNNANGVNQGVVNDTLIHQLSVDVFYTAQGKNFSVHLATLVNTSIP